MVSPKQLGVWIQRDNRFQSSLYEFNFINVSEPRFLSVYVATENIKYSCFSTGGTYSCFPSPGVTTLYFEH